MKAQYWSEAAERGGVGRPAMKALARWIRSHGVEVRDLGDRLSVGLPWSNTSTGEAGTEWVEVRDLREARAALGY